MQVQFCNKDEVADSRIGFAVIVARHKGKWVYVKQRGRATFEVPGGHREQGETIEMTAHRELYEETGATEYCLTEVSAYCVNDAAYEGKFPNVTYGMLYYAEVDALGPLPSFEMEELLLLDEMPAALTHPEIHPLLIKCVENMVVPKVTC